MKLSPLKLVALALSIIPMAAACSVDAGGADDDGDEVSESEAITAKVAPGQFKLYAQPHATPNPSCDVHTSLTLSSSGGSRAALREVVGGFCEIYVDPSPREYKLRAGSTACGSRVYTGSFRRGGQRHAIKITDHRTRTCKDLPPAKIIVEETRPGEGGPVTTTKYSSFTAEAPEDITVTGTFASVMGIGGESTGYGLTTTAGLYELVLDPGEANQFQDGKTARVTGKVTYLSGVETQSRRAIDVASMLVCPNPGWINCMPGPNVRLSNLCAEGNRSWVLENCTGVDFAF
jgi:hypothetical protein